jgi:hypothetical protein
MKYKVKIIDSKEIWYKDGEYHREIGLMVVNGGIKIVSYIEMGMNLL